SRSWPRPASCLRNCGPGEPIGMLFNSYTFLLLFLPIALAGFILLRRFSYRVGVVWLVLASLFYYAYWNPQPSEPWSPRWLFLILGSCVFNFFIGRGLSR